MDRRFPFVFRRRRRRGKSVNCVALKDEVLDQFLDPFEYDDGAICEYVRENPASCRAYYETLFTWTDMLPLHIVCHRRPSFQLVEAVYQAHPIASSETDRMGRLPLHHACRHRAPANVVYYLASRFPQGVRHQDYRGRLPLHCVSRRSRPEVIAYLLQRYPQGAAQKDREGRLPLHVACLNQASLETIQLLLKAYPGGVQSRDKHGELPLHLACANHCTLDVVQLLIQQYPESTTKGLWLPLHAACANHAMVEVVECLVSDIQECQQPNDSSNHGNNKKKRVRSGHKRLAVRLAKANYAEAQVMELLRTI